MDNNFKNQNQNQNVFQPNGYNQMPQQPVNNGGFPQQPVNNGGFPQQPVNNGQMPQQNMMGGFNQMPQQQFNGNQAQQQMRLNQTAGGSGNNNNNGLKIAIVAISILLIAAVIAIIILLTGKDDNDDKKKREDKTTQEVVTTEEPTTEEPTTEEPTTDEPTTAEPATEEPTTAEPATEEPTTEVSGTNPVDVSGLAFTTSDWTSLEFAIDGQVISWPLTYNDVVALGYSIDSSSEGETLESNHYTTSISAKGSNDERIYVRFKNFTDSDKTAKDCDIMGLSFDVDDCGKNIVLCNGITFGMTYDQVKGIMGEPSYYYISDDSTYESADYDVSDEAYSNSVSFTFIDGVLTEIEFENYDQ